MANWHEKSGCNAINYRTVSKFMAKMKRIEKTQEKIIQAALEFFVRKGYHGTSINNIMRKVGLTKAAYYAHFTRKGELFLRIISEYKSRYMNELIRKPK